MHKDHLEVFYSKGKFSKVLNLDGTINREKTLKGLGRMLDAKMMMDSKDFDALLEFYTKINGKNKDENNIDFPILELKEDIIDEIVEDLKQLKSITKDIATVDMERSLEEINYQYIFRDNLVKLVGVYGRLSSEFEDLYNLNAAFIQNLPEGPKDDSELIK